MENLKIEYLPIGSLKPYEKNAPECWKVYMHTFPNGKVYIGITSQETERRWRSDGYGYNKQGLIFNAICKYGWDNVDHKILACVAEKEEAEMLEKHYIKKYRANDRRYGYNIKEGGWCAKGHKLSEETRQKMGESRKGSKNWIYGKHLTDDVKQKLSEAHKGKKQDADAIRRGAAKRMGVNAYNARKVEQVDVNGVVIAVFSSLADAARYAGAHTQDVYNCCVGRQKSTHGTRWKYAEQADD